MVSSITLLTTVAALAAQGINAIAIQSIQQNGNCLQVDGTPRVGSNVILSGCNPNNALSATQTNQQWSIQLGNNDAVQLLGTLLCLDVASDTPDQQARLAVCNGSPTQTWYLTDDDHIAITGGNQCLIVNDNNAVTSTCGGANQPEQFFNFNLLFDTETATSLVSAPTTLPAGATSTGAGVGGVGVGAGQTTAATATGSAVSPISSIASSIASEVSSVISSASSAVGSGTGAAGGIIGGSTGQMTGTMTGTMTGAGGASGGIVGGSTGQMTGTMTGTGAMGTAASSMMTGAGAAGQSLTTNSDGVVSTVSGAASSATSGAGAAAGSVTSGAGGAAGSATSAVGGAASSATSGAGAAASSLVPLNAAVGGIELSRAALLLSAIAVGATMVI